MCKASFQDYLTVMIFLFSMSTFPCIKFSCINQNFTIISKNCVIPIMFCIKRAVRGRKALKRINQKQLKKLKNKKNRKKNTDLEHVQRLFRLKISWMTWKESNKHANASDLNIVFNFIYNVQILHYKIEIFYIAKKHHKK